MDTRQIGDLMARYGQGLFMAPDEARYMRSRQEFKVGDIVSWAPAEGMRLKVIEINGRTAKVMGQMFGQTRGFDADVWQLVKREE